MTDANPRVVYHYTSASAFKAISTYGQAWASKIQHLNDSKEYIHYISIFNKVSERRFSTQDLIEASFCDFVLEITSGMISANIFVASFTEKGDLLSQWRGYCPSGGYSIGFDLENLILSCERQGLTFSRAIYDHPNEDDIAMFLENVYRDYRPAYLESDTARFEILRSEIQFHIAQEGPRYKDNGFSEEAEWRAYSSILSYDDQNIDVVEIRGSLRPILKFDLGNKTELAANESIDMQVRDIFVSPGPDENLRRESAVILLSRNGVNYTRINRSKIPYVSR